MLRDRLPILSLKRSLMSSILRLTALMACIGGCASEDVEVASVSQDVAVTWQNVVGANAVANNLTKTAATAWGNSGASSVQSVSSDSFVEFTTSEATTAKVAGLSLGDSNQAETDVDFGFYPSIKNKLFIQEGTTLLGQFGTYVAGDVFRVESVERVVRYYNNGVLLHTSSRVPQFPAVLDAALHHIGATITNADISDFNFTNTVGVDILSTTSLRKTVGLPDQWGDSGAVSVRSIKADTGFVEFSSGETTHTKAAGLSTNDDDQHFNTIDFGWVLNANGTAQVFENGTLRFT
ncbi:MAG: hypothetical protein H0V17_14815, partial [Deltaproteobacteria bacterium]|nr:hypothetical protein [Deltaproteobacteria bacterium]